MRDDPRKLKAEIEHLQHGKSWSRTTEQRLKKEIAELRDENKKLKKVLVQAGLTNRGRRDKL